MIDHETIRYDQLSHERMTEKSCPMRALFQNCIQEGCAWWLEEHQCCAILDLAKSGIKVWKA